MKALNIFAYFVAGATLIGFVFGAVGAVAGGAALAKTIGLPGLGIGAVAGLLFGASRNFK